MLSKTVTKAFPSENMVGVHVKVTDDDRADLGVGPQTVIDQDFMENFTGGDATAPVKISIGNQAQEAIDNYKKRRAKFVSAAYETMRTQIDAGLILLIFLLFMLWPCISQAALTKTENTQAMEWTKITATGDSAGIKSTGSINVSACYAATLHIDVCLASTTAHEGTEIIIMTASESGVDDSWSEYARLLSTPNTAVKSDVKANEAIGQTVLDVTDPATGKLDHDGKLVFLYPVDDANVANCEIVYQIDNSGDAGDTITGIAGIEHALTVDTDVYTVDATGTSAVDTWAMDIPITASQVQVIFNNFYDDDGTASTVIARVRVTKVTGL